MIYLLIGRFASGRRYMADLLKNEIKPNKTTNEKVLSVLDDTDAIVQNNILIIQPNKLSAIAEADPSEAFEIIHVEADDMDRKLNYVKHQEKKIKAEKEFDRIDEDEDAMYCKFEDIMHQLRIGSYDEIPSNVTRCYHYVNEYSPTTSQTFADDVIMSYNLNKRISEIIIELNAANLLQNKHEKDTSGMLYIKQNDGTEHAVNATFFAELILDNNDNFSSIMKHWLIYKLLSEGSSGAENE